MISFAKIEDWPEASQFAVAYTHTINGVSHLAAAYTHTINGVSQLAAANTHTINGANQHAKDISYSNRLVKIIS